MKKIIRLTESGLTNLIKKIINESSELDETSLVVNPYELEPTDKGNVLVKKIINGKVVNQHYYRMEVYSTFHWWDCKVLDFPDGKKIKLKAAGQEKLLPIKKDEIKDFLEKDFGKSTIEKTVGDYDIRFKKVA